MLGKEEEVLVRRIRDRRAAGGSPAGRCGESDGDGGGERAWRHMSMVLPLTPRRSRKMKRLKIAIRNPFGRAAALAFALLPGLSSDPVTARSPAADAGFVIWESNRSGEYRIWRQDLAGGKPRPISTDEPGRDHCCAKLSPNGSRLVYLSLPGGARRYSQDTGELRLVDADGGRDRRLVAAARHYGEHRAAVWWGEDDLVYIDGRNATQRLRLSTGEATELVGPAAGEGWLLAPGGRVATGNTPTFSDYAAEKGVLLRPSLGGCQPSFTNDGRLAVWSAGAGGPIDALDLATRRSWTVLEKGDPHLPAERGYLYFPALSNDASLIAVGASPGEHDHFRADYDIYVVELDPRTLLPVEAVPAVAVAPDPAVDRFPDVYRPARPAAAGGQSYAGAAPVRATAEPPGAVAAARGLTFLWQRADAENRIGAGSASELLQPQGLAWLDRHRSLALGGGWFRAPDATGRRLAEGLVAKHQWTLSLLMTPASLHEQGPIVAFSDGPRARNLVLRQEGAAVVLALRTSDSAKEGIAVTVARLASTAPTHLLLTFSPGRLDAFVDGARSPAAAQTIALPGDLFPWRPRLLGFGAEAQNPARWHGTLAEIALWNRPLAAPEIAAEAARIRTVVGARKAVPRTVVEARLLASSPAPSRDEISPYREALVVDELEIVRQLAGSQIASPRIRVARWAILDDQALAAPRPGETYRLVLEPFAAQPQLAALFLADRLPAAAGVPLYFDLGATAAGTRP
jgi:hypothetical protein